jgi:hypothetical protein
MLRLLTDTTILALRRTVQSWLAALSIPIYGFVFILAARLLLPIPMLGSLLMGFVGAALCAGYLSLLASAVAGTAIRWSDLKNGLRAIWDVVSVLFIMWIIGLVLRPIVAGAGSRGPAIEGIVQLAIAIFFNAVPETLYLGGERSVQAIKKSASFVMEHPVAWFGPNLVLAFVFFWATGNTDFSSFGELLVRLSALASVQGVLVLILSAAGHLWKIPLLIVFVHFAMVFRGTLYRELGTGSTRMRDFRRRMGN